MSFTTEILPFRRSWTQRRPWASRTCAPHRDRRGRTPTSNDSSAPCGRECLDHVIVLNAAGLRTILQSYVAYYTKSRTHLSLEKDSPESRPVRCVGDGPVVAISQVGG